MITATLFIIVKRWKQPKYVHQLIKRSIFIPNGILFGNKKGMKYVRTTWTNLENVMLSESQSQKIAYYMNPFK